MLVGPALILTSIVLACGLAALAFSSLPLLRLFGWLSAFAMLAALVGDLLILRPTITFLMRLGRRYERTGPQNRHGDASFFRQKMEGGNGVSI